jgi:protein SCO1/2
VNEKQSGNETSPADFSPTNSRIILIFASGLVFIIIGLALLLLILRMNNSQSTTSEGESFDGSTRIDPPITLEDFTLSSQTGDSISLSELRGNVVLMTFGYTSCPDICPLTLDEFKRIKRNLGDAAEHVNFLFISVDGSRDTPERLTSYFDLRGIPDLIGMTGPEDEVRRIGREYNLFFEKDTESVTAASYLIAHTGGSFLIDQQGRWVMRYVFGTDPDLILNDITDLLGH